MQPTLIDTGPSARGFHRLESAAHCLQLYAYRHVLKLEGGDRGPLIRGTLGHVGLAHYYARMQMAQQKRDPNLYYEPVQAVLMKAEKMGPGATPYIDAAVDAVQRYMQHYAMETLRVFGVETVAETHFNGYLMTQRFDLVTVDSEGRYWIYDHKFVGAIQKKSVTRYALSGQFLEMVHQGQRLFGAKFAGVRINLVGVEDGKFLRESPPPSPYALQKFPQFVSDTEALIQSCATRDPWDYPRAFSETACMTPYGPCEGVDLCRWGPGGE